MTTIAWDGNILAADTMIADGNTVNYGTKIRKANKRDGRTDDYYLGAVGNSAVGLAMMDWWESGPDPDTFPKKQFTDDDQTTLIVIRQGCPVAVYSSCPFPAILDNKIYAAGSGRDFAIAAMHCGKTAKEAVEIAGLYDVYSGGNVDVLEVS